MSPGAVIVSYLVAQGVFADSQATPWPLFLGSEPDAGVDDVGTVFDTSGIKDGRLMEDGTIIHHYGIQVRVRSRDYEDGWDKLKQACDQLAAAYNVTVGTWTVHNVSIQGSPMSIGVDGTKRRRLFVANFLVTLTEA